MKRVLLLFAFSSLFSGCILDKDVEDPVNTGERLPEFEVVMNDGTIVTDASLAGKISLLMFFHTSCPDCQKALPVVQRIYDEYAGNGIETVLISREEGKDDISAYWAENGLNMPFSAQNDRDVYELFASSRIPRIYISDENRIVRYIYTDDPVPSYDDLRSALESLIR